MKKTLFIGSLILAMILAGCGEKSDVEVDEGATTNSSGGGNESMDTTGGDNSTISSSGSNSDISSSSLYSVYFGFDRFIVEGVKNIDTIKSNAKLIIESGKNVVIEGNTDEWGSDEYNYALALKRASSVKDALVNNNVSEDKISLVSYGESKPRCSESTRECWRENRRVDFVLNAQ